MVDSNPIAATDVDWLFLRKPAGIPVFPPHADPAGDCLLRRLLVVAPEQSTVSDHLEDAASWAGGILHRLDHWTSGLVVAARNPDALDRGRARFSEKALEKVYRFLTAGRPSWTDHVVDAALAHDRKRRSRMVWRRGTDTPHRGKWYPAKTFFRHVDGELWEARMRTGVMHQIRVHAASVGLPLRGDRLYGGAPHEDGRYFLHHRRLSGWDGAPELPEDWS